MKYFLKITITASLLMPLAATADNLNKLATEKQDPISNIGKMNIGFKAKLKPGVIYTDKTNFGDGALFKQASSTDSSSTDSTDSDKTDTSKSTSNDMKIESEMDFNSTIILNPVIPISFGKIVLINSLTAEINHKVKGVMKGEKYVDNYFGDGKITKETRASAGPISYSMTIGSNMGKISWGFGVETTFLPADHDVGYNATELEKDVADLLYSPIFSNAFGFKAGHDYQMAPAQVVTSIVSDKNSKNSFEAPMEGNKAIELNPTLGIFNDQPSIEGYQWASVGPDLKIGEIRPHYVRAQNPTGAYSILAVTPVLDDETKVATENDAATLSKASYIDDENSGVGKLFKRDIGIGFSLTGFYKTGKFNGGLGFQYKMYLAKGIHELNFKPYLAYNFTNGIYITALSKTMSLKMMDVQPVTSLVMGSGQVPEVQIAEMEQDEVIDPDDSDFDEIMRVEIIEPDELNDDNEIGLGAQHDIDIGTVNTVSDTTVNNLISHASRISSIKIDWGTAARVNIEKYLPSLQMTIAELEELRDNNKIGLGVQHNIAIGTKSDMDDNPLDDGIYHASTIVTGSSGSSSDSSSSSSGDGGISVTRFSMPLGAGVGKVFKVGKSAIDLHLSYYYTLNIDTLNFEKLSSTKGWGGDGTDASTLKIDTTKPPAENENNRDIFSGGHHDIGLSISFLIPK